MGLRKTKKPERPRVKTGDWVWFAAGTHEFNPILDFATPHCFFKLDRGGIRPPCLIGPGAVR